MVASVTASYTYAEGERVTVSVEVENEYPDALDQAKATAVAGVRDLTGIDTEVDAEAIYVALVRFKKQRGVDTLGL